MAASPNVNPLQKELLLINKAWIFENHICASVAQTGQSADYIAQLPCKQDVEGSNPSRSFRKI